MLQDTGELKAPGYDRRQEQREQKAEMSPDSISGGAGRLVELAERAETAEKTAAGGRTQQAEAFARLLAHGIAAGNGPGGHGAFIQALAEHGPPLTLGWIQGRLHVRNPKAIYRDPMKWRTRGVRERAIEGDAPDIRIARCLQTWSRMRRWNETNTCGIGIEGWYEILEAVTATAARLKANAKTLRTIAASGRLYTPGSEGTGTTIELDNRKESIELWLRTTRRAVLAPETTPHGHGNNVLRLKWTSENGLVLGPAEAATIMAGRIIADARRRYANMPNTAGWHQLLRELAARTSISSQHADDATDWVAVDTESNRQS